MKRSLFILSLILLLALLLVPFSAQAITQRSVEEIKAWLDNEIANQQIHGDGQCVYLCNDYLTQFWQTSRISTWYARYWECHAGFVEVDHQKKTENLMIGDLIVEDYDPYGHVCIFYGIEDGYSKVVQQNSDNGVVLYPTKGVWGNPFSQPTRVYRGPIGSSGVDLDVNFLLDGEPVASIDNIGSFSITVNETKNYGQTDYCAKVPKGTEYLIEDIATESGYRFVGQKKNPRLGSGQGIVPGDS